MTNPLLEKLKSEKSASAYAEGSSIALRTIGRHPLKRKKFDPTQQLEPEPSYGSDPGLERDYDL